MIHWWFFCPPPSPRVFPHIIQMNLVVVVQARDTRGPTVTPGWSHKLRWRSACGKVNAAFLAGRRMADAHNCHSLQSHCGRTEVLHSEANPLDHGSTPPGVSFTGRSRCVEEVTHLSLNCVLITVGQDDHSRRNALKSGQWRSVIEYLNTSVRCSCMYWGTYI